MDNIGEIIREHRKRKNMTQEELGKQLFVSKQAISKWENGRTVPGYEIMQKLMEILEIDGNEIPRTAVPEVKKIRKTQTILFVAGVIAFVMLCVFIGFHYFKDSGKTPEELGHQESTQPENQYPLDVTMTQLLATPEKYDGKLIRVIGVGNLEFEGDCLSPSKEDYAYYTLNSIWIELGRLDISYEEAQKYNGKYVIVEGIFDKDDRGHMDMFCGSIKKITRYDLWERE